MKDGLRASRFRYVICGLGRQRLVLQSYLDTGGSSQGTGHCSNKKGMGAGRTGWLIMPPIVGIILVVLKTGLE